MPKRTYDHFHLKLNGVDFVYTYIRKNACSSFKKIFAAKSPMKKYLNNCQTIHRFMVKYHKINLVEEIDRFENRIAIIRDPYSRVVSAYLNQFIQNFGKQQRSDMYNSIKDNIDISPHLLTFRAFLSEYLTKIDYDNLDCHFWSQKEHLAPVKYNHLWLLDDLYENAKHLFDKKVADQFFSKKVNATSLFKKYDDDAADLPAYKIHDRFVKEGSLPSVSAFLVDDLDAVINELYVDDFKLFDDLKC
ncbi:sulfotransferase family 2 domain-containing protein [Dapis sp. BLCC M229]|uniref:sulfotransferase family 2 domain-containing protein n=1 Tax=Dapis sp. BLCC M229 TaxID=3400188 RepID=UPI003CE9A79E